ncbi:unnamed protein product, partial [Lymnaea stagnalis]
SPCPTGFTGEKCEMICHCQNEACDVNGHCTDGSSCTTGWFGAACQYRNFAQGLNELLTDNEDSTCYKSDDKSIEAKLSRPLHFSWIRL